MSDHINNSTFWRDRMTLCDGTHIRRERAPRDACLSALPKQMFPPPLPAGIAVLIPGPACHTNTELMARDLTLRWPKVDRLQESERAEPAG